MGRNHKTKPTVSHRGTYRDPDSIVLIAILNNRRDFQIARDQHWYRIPVERAPRGLHEATHV